MSHISHSPQSSPPWMNEVMSVHNPSPGFAHFLPWWLLCILVTWDTVPEVSFSFVCVCPSSVSLHMECVRQLNINILLVVGSGCKVYSFFWEAFKYAQTENFYSKPRGTASGSPFMPAHLKWSLFTWFNISNWSMLLQNCYCLHHNCSLRFVTEYIFLKHLPLIAFCSFF